MNTTTKSVKIPLNSYLQLEEIRLYLIQKRLSFTKGEIITYSLDFLRKQLLQQEGGKDEN
jgi:hypothetical protein